MSATELIANLSSLGVRLWAEGNQLRFKAPPGVLTPELKGKLVEHKHDLIEFLNEVQASVKSAGVPPISSMPRHGDVPLSYSQERLWFAEQWDSGSAVYSIFDAILIEGRLDVTALTKSLHEIVRRHEILRTTFVIKDGQPFQRIAEEATHNMEVLDLRHLPAQRRDAEMQRFVHLETARPFDLSQGPLMRVALFQLDEEQHALLFNLHHIVSDGWSTGVLINEVISLYKAFATGEASPLPALPIQYADYALWQRQWLGDERLKSEATFWKEKLKGAPASLDLPTDRPRPSIRTSRGATYHFTLSPSVSGKVRRLSQQERVTPYMVLLAAWKVLLWKYTGQEDIVVGSPHANRNRTELESLIGFFVNTLVLRTNLSGNPRFIDLLSRIRETTLTAQAHKDLPFEKLVDEVQPERDLSRTPLFQVSFTFQNAPVSDIAAPGLHMRRLQFPVGAAKYDLALIITDSEPAMSGEIEYSTDLFDEGTIARLASRLETLLADAAAYPDLHIADLRVLDEAEYHQLVVDFNATGTKYPHDKLVHELFEQQADERPEAIAVVCGQQQISYAELNRRANQLAHYLIGLGVGPEVSVGVCLDRDIEMIVALLGVLKAGGAYVPLDPEYPIERLAFMIEESGVMILLTQESLEESLPSSISTVICLDVEQEMIQAQATGNPPRVTGEDNLAYVMFTSGSTGKPKGIAVCHRSIVRLVRQNAYANFGPEEVFLQFAPISFDASTFEIWGSLLNGARLVVVPQKRVSLEELGQVIRENEVTTLWLTAGLFHQMVESRLDDLRHVRQLLAGGDVLSAHHVQKALQELPGCRLINGYGPTEGTTFTCCYSMTGDTALAGNVPIGRPIANTRVYILDSYLQCSPLGVAGELYIAGDGLARAYVNSPRLTAEKFIPNPFDGVAGTRMYRTGDLARYLPDGNIEFLGRIDSQVKIRGFRIELGEIEAALSQHASVEQAVVVAREDTAGDKQLVAYLVPEEESGLAVDGLRAYLKRQLPDYMVPSAFVMMERLPLTPNGKVDRKALPAPERTGTENGHVSPRTLTEELLAGIWSDVLNVERVDVNDNFFDLGGHSLLATQVMARIGDSFHLSLPLKTLFESPTVAGLAERIEVALVSGRNLEAPPIQPVPRDKPLPLSFAQENLWLFEQLTPGTPSYNTCRAGRMWGPLDVDAAEATFNFVLQRHEVLRTSYESVDATPVQVIHPHTHYTLPVIDLSELPEAAREAEAFRLSNADAQRPINLSQSPVARAQLLRLGPEDHVFILSIHHIAFDLWSGGVLLEEIERAYLSYLTGEPPLLSPLPVQCADFAVWQRNWLKGEAVEAQFAYWKERLAGLSSTPMKLPADRPQSGSGDMSGTSEYPVFSKSLSEGIKELARRENVTQFMALLAVFQLLLHRYTEQDDIVVGSVIANRNHVELEGVVGFFDNPIVLRVDASGNPSFREFLQRVRDVALGAYANQHLPFDVLIKELQPERLLNRTPLIQAMFVFLLNYPAMEREIAGLKVVPYKLHSGQARFDLAFGLRESGRGLEGELEYNREMFESATIKRMLKHYERLLEAVVSDPDVCLSEIPMLTEAERQQVLVEWNRTAYDYPRGKTVHELFETQAAREPSAIAVRQGDEAISYGELNRRANQLAERLRELGVGPEVIVGICMERSVHMIVGLLGILKAGGAYLPLDPAQPPERLTFILADARAKVVLTQNSLLGKFEADEQLPGNLTGAQTVSGDGEVRFVCVDAESEAIGTRSGENLSVSVAAENLAYVIYTSGSTGRPKGVALAHKGLVNLVSWHRRFYGLTPEARATQVANISFDASVWELWPYLTTGASVHLLTEEQRLSPDEMVAWLHEQQITHSFLPTPLAEAVLEQEWPAGVALKALLTGGDQLRRRPRSGMPFRMVNHYGPTEATVVTTYAEVEPESDVLKAGLPHIGRPISNFDVYVLDSRLEVVPVGVAGELYVGGDGLARCYHARPALTAERFIPHPYSSEPGARLYKTGDLVRYRADGELEFLGRTDHQVKVRGFRIELGEIEAVLVQHPQVSETVVTVSSEGDDKRLVAYVVSQPQTHLVVSELKQYLSERLPHYMVPAQFVELDELPLMPSGKVDRRALPAPGAVRVEGEQPALAPRDEVELQLTRIWEELFGMRGIGIRDNFFELGGHSLLSVHLAVKVKEQFGRELSLSSLLQNPTVEHLASILRRDAPSARRSALVAIRPEGTKRPFFCVHPVGGNVLCYMEFARQLGPEQPFYAFQLPEFDGNAGSPTVEMMAAHYLEHLRKVQPEGPYRLGGWSMGGVVAFEMARSLEAQGEDVELLALIDSPVPSNIPRPERLDDHALVRLFVEDLEGISGRSLGLSFEESPVVELHEVLRILLDRVRASEILPLEFGLAELQSLFYLYQTNLKALLTYEPQEYAGKVTLFRSTASAAETGWTLGWDQFARSGVETHEIDGDHYSIITGQPVRILAAQLGEMLGRETVSADVR